MTGQDVDIHFHQGGLRPVPGDRPIDFDGKSRTLIYYLSKETVSLAKPYVDGKWYNDKLGRME